MMKILIITTGFRPNIGGLETHLDDLCRYLVDRGHKVYVITYQPLITRTKGPKFEKNGNLEIHRVQWFGHWFYRFEPYPLLHFIYMFPGIMWSSLSYLYKHRKDGVDVIHAHGIIAALVAKILKKVFKIRCVMSTHTIYGLEKRSFLAKAVKWILSSFDAVLALAPKSKEELVRIGLPENVVQVYTHWLDLDTFRPQDRGKCKAELGLEGKFVALFLSRIAENKGVNQLLTATSLGNPDIHYVFVGDGPLTNRVREVTEIKTNVKYFGPVSNEETPKYYNAADIFVLPAQYEEPFGRVIAEAFACGTPALVSNRGTLPLLVPPSVGIVIEPTAEHFASMLESIYKNPEKLRQMKANCRPYALAHFSDRNAELILSSYKTDKTE